MSHKAVFLDKDGTLIPDIPYNVAPSRITLMSGAATALARLRDAGYLLIIISNQSGIAKGYFKEDDLRHVHRRIGELLAVHHVRLDGFYYCPHLPDGEVPQYAVGCDCRKPQPGLLFRAAKAHNIDLAQSWMIGDILNDVEAGNRAGCRSILVDNGGETEWLPGQYRAPVFTVANLQEAAAAILQSAAHPEQPLAVR